MQSIKFKRIMAYLIDILIVSLLALLVSKINFLNPYQDKYDKAYKEYEKIYTSIQDGSIDYNKLLKGDYIDVVYDISKYSISYNIIEFIVILLYFTFFPKFNNNQTIGKRLFKLEIKPLYNKKLTIKNHLLRSLFLPIWTSSLLYINIYNFINILVLLLASQNIYFYIISIVSIICCIYSYIDIIFMIVRKDNLALHDIISKSKVEMK